MTDATLSVTQSRLETFAREYLNTLGASIRETGSRWHVRLPDHVDVPFIHGREFTVGLGQQPDEHVDDYLLAPDSEFAQQLLEEASSMASVGHVSVSTEEIEEYEYPEWIAASDVRVAGASFTPYYDRNAVVALVKVGVETVSEYQTQFLEAIAIDMSSKQPLPSLADTVLNSFFEPETTSTEPLFESSAESDPLSQVGHDTFSEVIAECQDVAIENLRDSITNIRASASRSADSEFDEYRQLQEQRLSDLKDDLDSVSRRLEKVAEEVEHSDSHQQRVEALQKREELQAKKEDLENKQAEILRKKQTGFKERRREIYNRHSLKIVTAPVVGTVVSYERGEITFQLESERSSDSLQVPYAAGVGTTDNASCNHCQASLSTENHIVIADGIKCRSCSQN